jgi:mRNA-degrading endonuclease toxin of MazEF toxin-antitoxin module
MNKTNKFPHCGEIWLIKCDKIKEFSKPYRPVLIISKDIQNEFDEMTVVVPLTTDNIENIRPLEVFINKTLENGLEESSKIIVNRPYAIFKKLRLVNCLGRVSPEIMNKAKKAWELAFDLEI